jgi:hypothetical protein
VELRPTTDGDYEALHDVFVEALASVFRPPTALAPSGYLLY